MSSSTTNGLPYPVAGDAIASQAALIQALAQALDDKLLAAWTAYTPTWTGASANPAIGNGTRVGAYRERGKSVDFRIAITFGSTTTFGTGAWMFSLPTPVKAGTDDVPVGSCLIKRGSTRKGRVTAIDTAASQIVRCYEAGAAGGAMASTSEAWAAADFIMLNGTYERS